MNSEFKNPFRPGAGHMPPYLAGRQEETKEFTKLLTQDTILENLILTGRRGVGKTVLLDTFKPLAIEAGWLWVGTNLSESASLSEENIATRLLTDLSVVTSTIVIAQGDTQAIGFAGESKKVQHVLNFKTLGQIYAQTPGLVADKLKNVLEFVWRCQAWQKSPGLVFAYDEAQNLSDHADKNQYPLALLLDVFQSIQKKDIPFMLVLTGLPTLFPKLVEARTFAERMFRVVQIDRLNRKDSRDAIRKPIEDAKCPIKLSTSSVETITSSSGGYPYFIQFICREVYDVFIQKKKSGERARVPVEEITRKLDTDFFAGRWARATDRQRDLLAIIATLDSCDAEFTVQEIVEASKKEPDASFSASHANQMLSSLCEAGLVFKNRHGRYSLGVPLLGEFIKRQIARTSLPT
jgi:hypothetical protein